MNNKISNNIEHEIIGEGVKYEEILNRIHENYNAPRNKKPFRGNIEKEKLINNIVDDVIDDDVGDDVDEYYYKEEIIPEKDQILKFYVEQIHAQNLTKKPLFDREYNCKLSVLQEKYSLKGTGKPDFMLIGVAKGGTTSFSNYIVYHPYVDVSGVKEPNFFSWLFNVGYYKKEFGHSNKKKGDYTTSYITHPLAPRRIITEVPDIKFVLLIRNPIDRAYSHYIMSVRANIEDYTFDEIVEKELKEIMVFREKFNDCFHQTKCNPLACLPQEDIIDHKGNLYSFKKEADLKRYLYTSYLFRSLYVDQVYRWIQTLGPNWKDQLLIINSDDFYKDTPNTMNKVCDFYGFNVDEYVYDFNDFPELFDKSWGGGASNRYENPHEYPPMNNSTRELLQYLYKPFNEQLFDMIGQRFDWD